MSILFYNGKVSTLTQEQDTFQAIGLSENKIDFLGDNRQAMQALENYDTCIDLKGKLVLPGFNDSHLHVLGYGMTQNSLLLENCNSIDEIISAARSYIIQKDLSTSDILLGRGWNQDHYENQQMLTRKDLDKVSTTIPIVLRRVCGHIAVVNSVVIEKLDILELLKNENVNIEKGHFEEDALDILNKMMKSPSVENIKNAILLSCDELLSYGITSVQTDDFSALAEEDYHLVLTAYEEMNRDRQLPLRVYHQSLLPSEKVLREFLNQGYNTGIGDKWFKMGPLKLLLDGSLGNRTAKLVDDYSDKPGTRGIVIYDQNELNGLIKMATEHKMQVAVHAIGDKAIYMTLDAIKASREDNNNLLRHGIVHCQITDSEIINRLADENIMAYIQPIFLDYDMGIVEKRVGKAKAQTTYAFKTMMNKGINMCGGSDAPVVHFNIFDNLYSAITRKNLKGKPENGWMQEECLTVNDALELFTKNGAYASFEEDIKGTLEIGKLGDLAIIDRDIYTIPPDEIRKLKVEFTVVDGKIVYERRPKTH